MLRRNKSAVHSGIKLSAFVNLEAVHFPRSAVAGQQPRRMNLLGGLARKLNPFYRCRLAEGSVECIPIVCIKFFFHQTRQEDCLGFTSIARHIPICSRGATATVQVTIDGKSSHKLMCESPRESLSRSDCRMDRMDDPS